MKAKQESATAFLPMFTAASNEKYMTKRVNSFILIEDDDFRSSLLVKFEKTSSCVPTTRRVVRQLSNQVLLEPKVPATSNPLNELLGDDRGISKDPTAEVKSGRRSGLDVEVQKELARQDSQHTFAHMDGSRKASAPAAIQESSPPPSKASPPFPIPPDPTSIHTEPTSGCAECSSRYHKSQPNRRAKSLTERLMGGLKGKYRDVRGRRKETQGLVCGEHENRSNCGVLEHSDIDSYGSVQQWSSDCRIDSGVALVSPETPPHQTPKSNPNFRAWLHPRSIDSKSNHRAGASTATESMRSRISSFMSMAKRVFSKSRSRKSSRLGSNSNDPPPEGPLCSFITDSKSLEQAVSGDPEPNVLSVSQGSGTGAGMPAIANSTNNRSPPLWRYSSYAVYEEHDLLELDIRIITGGPPRPFQCTFCLAPCDEESEWIQHEWSHFPQHGWTCMINGQTHNHNGWISCGFCGDVDQNHDFSQHNTDHCTNKRILARTFTTEFEMKRHLRRVHGDDHVMAGVMQSWKWPQCMDEWRWYCGFCDTVLRSWDERKDHLNEHFRNGETMSTWDPLTSPYPWSKQLSTPVPGFPRWEPSKLLAIQQHTMLDLINRVAEPRQLNQCDLCDITPLANFGEFTRHMILWHHPKKSWSCPSLTRGWKLTDFFEPCSEHCEESAQEGCFCLCCREEFCEVSANGDMRKKHLQEKHHFTECHHDKFFTQDQFFLHLANSHNVDLESVGNWADLCWKEERPPALMTRSTVG